MLIIIIIAGLTAANRAAQLGLKALVLEQGSAEKYLCNSRYTGGSLFKADRIAALAQTIGVPAAALAQTVQAYNAAHTGSTLLNLSPPRRAEKYKPLPITQGPFYAAPLCIGITNAMGGIAINEHAQALREDGSIIAGLYVAGAAAGGLEGGPEVAYTGGLVKGGVMGLRAAEHMAQSVGRNA